MDYQKIIVDEPRPMVRRITLNRPHKRNPLFNPLRGEMFHALETADQDPDVRVMIIRAGIRAGTEMQQLATFTKTTQAYFTEMRKGLTQALTKRDAAFGDYRTADKGG